MGMMSVLSARARQRLLRWFDRHARALPWRADRDPYRIWVSEVMLQQTQAATVTSYFEQFLKQFPTVKHLAAADEQQVLRAWEGLGYYRRARHLHQAAQVLARLPSDELPSDPAVWAQLPGVGRYILGAVLSQAFEARLPIVEANTRRLLSRLFGQQGEPNSAEVTRWLWQTAQDILPRRRIGDFNQALMELGALICTPKRPQCSACPLRSGCVAYRAGLQEKITGKGLPPAPEEVREIALVVRQAARVLLVRRPSTGRWANMWEFPHAALATHETHELVAHRLLSELGLTADLGDRLQTIRHGVTRFRITMECLAATYRSGEFHSTYYEESRWLEPEALTDYPVSSPQRRLAQRVREAF
jgi:A/G-specific adenine glycosylase